MNRSWRVMRVAAAALALITALSSSAWARDEDQASSGSAQPSQIVPPTGYQPGMPASSAVIGYQPIPNSTLGLPSVTGVSPQASAPGPTQLPLVYLTGVGGDGFYTLGRDDVIRVEVRNQPEFSGDFIVGFDGRIQYNYLGDLPVAGLTKHEVQQVLEKLLEQYVRVPVVTVMIIAYNSKVIYVIGEVNRPGKYIMRGDTIKLRDAILAAGLPTRHAALSRTHVIKPDLENPLVRKINLKTILYKGKLAEDINLSPSEIVVVPSTVLSSINRFLGDLLNPITRTAAAAALGVGVY